MIALPTLVIAFALAQPPASANAYERAWRALHDANDPRAALVHLEQCAVSEPDSAAALRVELLGLATRLRLGEDDAVRERALALRSRAASSPVLALELAELVAATTPPTVGFAPAVATIVAPTPPRRGTFDEPCPSDADRTSSAAADLEVDDAPIDEAAPDEPWVAPTFTAPIDASAREWHEGLDAHASTWADALERFEGEPSTVVALLGRRHALDLGLHTDDAYELATFSFVFGTRRALPEVRNTWELQHGNSPGRVHVRMTTNQLHALARCDDSTWPPTVDATASVIAPDERAIVAPGDVFVERIAWKGESSGVFLVAFQVLALEESDVLVLRWERIDDAARRDAFSTWFSSTR
ncbi:MAG: hypothetical protein IPH13_05865 [Planctomycetes bacterium]|nr:hypothetical protein [Planctomycetota bacterium]